MIFRRKSHHRSRLAEILLGIVILVAGGVIPGVMFAQSGANGWSVRRPYIEFYDKSPYNVPTPIQVTGKAEAGGFDVMTRYRSPTALAKTFNDAGISDVPKPPELSIWLSQQEAVVEKNYVPLLERWGHLQPTYEEIAGPANDRRLIFFADGKLGDDTYGEYSSPLCLGPTSQKRAAVAISPLLMKNLKDPGSALTIRAVLTHELLHGSQHADRLCGIPKWIAEGGPDGYAIQAAWLTDVNAGNIRTYAKDPSELYQPRRYYLPLDLDLKDVQTFAQKGGLAAGAPIPTSELFEQKTTQDYYTGSYFRYLMDSQKSGAAAYELFYARTPDRTKYYDLIRKTLKVDAPQHIAAFYTEFASYGGGRYKYFNSSKAKEGVISVSNAETDIRKSWLQETFACGGDAEVQLDGSTKTARSIVDLPNFAPLSGRCFRVIWEDVKPSVNLSVQVLVETRAQAESIWLGQSYVKGASHNQPKYSYCYQNVTNGGGSYGEPISNDRGSAAAVDSCLFRKSEIRENVKLDGKTYFAVTFTTKYKVGTEAGEADFIVTNAAPKAKDNQMFNARVLVQKVSAKISWNKTGDHALDKATASNTADKDIWAMVTNRSDVYFNPSTKASRDLKMQGADTSGMLAALDEMEEDSAATMIGGDGFMLQIGDIQSGSAAMLMSLDGRYMAVGGAENDGFEFAADCGLKNDFKVKQHNAEGLSFTYDADVMDIHALMAAATSGRDPSCEDVRKAIYDRVSIEMFLPDGQLHTYDGDIKRTFPDGYDDAVNASLTANGIADLGGLPRRVDQATFLDGMNGAPPSGMTYPSMPSGPPTPPAPPTSPGSPGVNSGGSCSAPDVDEARRKLDALAQTCTCTCAALNKTDDDLDAIMENVGPSLMQNSACAEPLMTSMTESVQRLLACRMNTCASIAGQC